MSAVRTMVAEWQEQLDGVRHVMADVNTDKVDKSNALVIAEADTVAIENECAAPAKDPRFPELQAEASRPCVMKNGLVDCFIPDGILFSVGRACHHRGRQV